MHIGLVYDLRDDYLVEGYSALDVAEFDGATHNCAVIDATAIHGPG